MAFCGIPIFFQEVAIGQYLGSGGMTLVAQLCPMLKGQYFEVFFKTHSTRGPSLFFLGRLLQKNAFYKAHTMRIHGANAAPTEAADLCQAHTICPKRRKAQCSFARLTRPAHPVDPFRTAEH